MVADSFSFAVFIRRYIDIFALFGHILHLLDNGAVLLVHTILRFKSVVFELYTEAVFGQVPDVPFGCNDFVIFAQKVFYCSSFGG